MKTISPKIPKPVPVSKPVLQRKTAPKKVMPSTVSQQNKNLLQRKESNPFSWMSKNPVIRQRVNTTPAQSSRQNIVQPKVAKLQPPSVKPQIVQPRLEIGQPGDKYEREADKVADTIVSMPDPTPQTQLTTSKQSVQRSMGGIIRPSFAAIQTTNRLNISKIQTSGGTVDNATRMDVESKLNNSSGRGSPMDEKTRSFFEPRFGENFEGVKIHTDANAARMNVALGSYAFAYGNNIFFNHGQYQPETMAGKRLLAHELTHVVQQGAVVRRQSNNISRAPPMVQCGVFDGIRRRINNIAVNIPGYQLVTTIIGYNFILGESVPRSASNLILGFLRLVPPLGTLLAAALERSEKFQEAAAWIDGQIASLGVSLGELTRTLDDALNAFSAGDILDPGGAIDRTINFFRPYFTRAANFASAVFDRIVKFLKETILKPLGDMARTIRGYDALCFIMGFDPVTGEAVPRTAENLVRAFCSFMEDGQTKFQYLQQSRAIPKAFEWFNQQISSRNLTWARISGTFTQAWESLSASDVLSPIQTIQRIVGIVRPLLADIVGLGIDALLKILEIIFEAVMGGGGARIIAQLKAAGGAFMTVIRNPAGFMGNLVNAVKLGIQRFAGNILNHLRTGMIEWLTGGLARGGITLPATWDLRGIVGLVLQVLGLTYARIRPKLVTAFTETGVRLLETGFELVRLLVTQGPMAAWNQLMQNLANVRDTVINGIKEWIQQRIVVAAITRLATFFNPIGAFIQAILGIYNTVMFFIERINQILSMVNAVLQSMANIANGNIAAAAAYVEQSMARAIPVILSFLARLIGIGDIAGPIRNILQRIQAPIDRAVDALINWIRTAAMRLLRAAASGVRQIVQWWRNRKTFRGNDGSSHSLYFAGEGRGAVLTVATTPLPVEGALQTLSGHVLVRTTGSPENAAFGSARGLLPRIRTLINTVQDRSSDPNAYNPTDIDNLNNLLRDLSNYMAVLVPLLSTTTPTATALGIVPNDIISFGGRHYQVISINPTGLTQYAVLRPGQRRSSPTGEYTPSLARKLASGEVTKVSDTATRRELFMGPTPNRSRSPGTYAAVKQRMARQGKYDSTTNTFRDRNLNAWFPEARAAMGHVIDAVRWWNSNGRLTGAQSPVVLQFMADADNYELEETNSNSSRGASLGATYLNPVTKLMIGSVDHPLEREADQVADKVVSMPDSPLSSPSYLANSITQAPAGAIKRSGGAEVPAAFNLESKLNSTMGTGSSMDTGTKNYFEGRFGADFSGVRIHTGSTSVQMNNALGSAAFAHGNDIHFNKNQYNPTSAEGKRLIAHELTHVVQQNTAIRRKPLSISNGAIAIQRISLSRVANIIDGFFRNIPGYTLVTVLIGRNFITGRNVERNAVNLLDGFLGLLGPVGNAISLLLQRSGILQEAGGWITQQIAQLGVTWDTISAALNNALNAFSLSDLLSPSAALNRTLNFFRPFFDRVVRFASNVLAQVVVFLKRTLLQPLSNFARQIPGYGLFTFIIGRDPFTGNAVERSAINLVGAVMQLIPGGEEKFRQVQESRALEKVFAWVRDETTKRNLSWERVAATFAAAWNSLSAQDILQPLATLQRIAGIFRPLLLDVMGFVGSALEKILEFIFQAAMGAGGTRVLSILQRARSTFVTIVRNPVAFLGNLVNAVKLGIRQFAGNILNHLRNGLVGWLTGGLAGAGLRLPQQWNLRGILDLVLQILGLTYDRVRQKLVRLLGETAVRVLETSFELVVILVRDGPMAAWQRILEHLGNLQQMVMDGIRGWVQQRVVIAAVTRLATMFNPVGAVIQAILATYNTIMFFVERINQIFAFVESVTNSVASIAAGNIGGAANYIEQSMARTIPIILGFLARLIGLGDIATPVRRVITQIQTRVDQALDRVVEWIRTAAQRLLQAGRNAVAAVVQWWRTRRQFRTANGETHTLYFTGEQGNARLTMASDPIAFEELINQMRARTNVPERLQMLASALAKKQQLDQYIRSQEQAQRQGRQTANLQQEINNRLELIRADIVRAGFGANPEPLALSNVSYSMAGGRSRTIRAEPLTKLPGNTNGQPLPGGTTPPFPQGWPLVSRINATGTVDWRRIHLLSHRMHGPIQLWNLVPGRTAMNSAMETIESGITAELYNDNKTLSYTVTVNYHQGGAIQDQTGANLRGENKSNYPQSVTVQIGEYVQASRRFVMRPPINITQGNALPVPGNDNDPMRIVESLRNDVQTYVNEFRVLNNRIPTWREIMRRFNLDRYVRNQILQPQHLEMIQNYNYRL